MAASLLQSLVRTNGQYKAFDLDVTRINKCQTIDRARNVQERYLELVDKVAVLQQLAFRSFKMDEYEAEEEYIRTWPQRAGIAAITIQKVFRGYLVRKHNADEIRGINSRLGVLA
jgi:IQ calmodulin-binding motif